MVLRNVNSGLFRSVKVDIIIYIILQFYNICIPKG
jgi:hypothetical protein